MKEIAKDIPGDKIKLTKNAPPIPTNVKFVFEETIFKPVHIIFQYDNKMKNGREIMEWVRQYSEAVTGRPLPPKETLVFDGEFYFEGREFRGFEIEGRTLEVYSMLLKNAEFLDPVSEDDIVLTMEMSYEHFHWVI